MSSEDLHFQCVDILAKDVFIKDVDSDSDSDSKDKKEKKDYTDFKKKEEGMPDISDNKKMFTILLFGTDMKGQSICLEIQNFEPFFFIRVPNKYEDKAVECLDLLRDYLLEFVHENAQSKLTFKLEKHKTLWDYNLDAYSHFIKISFPSLDLFRRIKDKLLDKKNIPIVFKTNEIFGTIGEKKLGKFISFEIYESNIDPVLRFFHIQDISPAGWVTVKKGSYLDNDIGDAKTHSSYVADWKDVNPSKEGTSIMAPLLIGSWDIECMSSHGDFPLPKKTWRKIARELIENKINDLKSICKQIAHGIRLGAKGKPLPSLADSSYKISPIYLKRGPNDIDANLDESTIEGMVSMSGRGAMLLEAFRQDLEKATNDVETQLTAIFPPICGDPVIQIGTVLYRKNTAVSKHIWVLGSCDRDLVKPPGASVPIEVYVFDNEASLIKSWARWIGKADIDVLIGYNIFGFDEKFLYERCEELGIANLLYPFSRLMSSKVRLEEKFLSSAAMGDNTMYVLKSTGRLQIDMLHYVRRNYNLDSYTLDNVSATFVSGNIIGEVEQQEDDETIFKFKTKSTKGIVKGRYITLMDEENDRVIYKSLVLNVEPKALTILIEGGLEELNESGVKAVKWAQVKDDVSPKELFALHKGDAKDRAKIAKYCLQDCDLVIELFNKLEVLNNSVAMANVCSVPVSFIFTRGQGIKIESLIFKQCMLNDKLIVVLPSPRQRDEVIDDDETGNDPSYEGAIVLDPKTGIYIDDPVTALDFASLYPSTIISENISHDTLIWVKEYDNDMNYVQTVEGSDRFDNLEGASYVNIEFDLLVPDPDSDLKHKPKIKQGIRIARYVQTAVPGRDTIGLEGTIPKILKMLLASRKEARKAAEKEEDEFTKALLDAKQLAYKLTANALYGQLGSGTFKIRRQVLAASTTAYGRKQLMYAKKCIEDVYGSEVEVKAVGCKTAGRDPRCCAEYVYGDSVTGDTPLLIQTKDGYMNLMEIHDLIPSVNWSEYHETKEMFIPIDDNNMNIWTEKGWTKIMKVIRHKLDKSKKMFRIQTGAGYVDVSSDHSLLKPDGTCLKPTEAKIGMNLMHSLPPKVENLCVRSFDYSDKMIDSLKYLLNTDKYLDDSNTKIISIEEIEFDYENDYVYDLETENHHFGVGPGALIVHNTDSVFIKMSPRNPDTGELLHGKEAIEKAKELTEEAGKLISKCLKPPHDFEFDKIFRTFCLLSKKRYVGDMSEGDLSEDGFHRKAMGIVMKRRDNAPIVKYVYGGIVDRILDPKLTDVKSGVLDAFEFVQSTAKDLLDGKFKLNKLTITKSLRAEYADPTRIAHKVLADRIGERDPGNAPSTTERIPFVYIATPPGKPIPKLQGDRIETPKFIIDNHLKPDYEFYITNQIAKPVSQVFALALEYLPGIKTELKMTEKARDVVAAREALAEKVLFEKLLMNSKMKTTGQKAISTFFKKM
jgi:DNA polymerase elongation subunit (family B)